MNINQPCDGYDQQKGYIEPKSEHPYQKIKQETQMASTPFKDSKPLVDLRLVADEISMSKALVIQLGSLLRETLKGQKQADDGSRVVQRALLSLSKIETLLQTSAVHTKRVFPEDGNPKTTDGSKEGQPSKKTRFETLVNKTKIDPNVKICNTFTGDEYKWRKYGQKVIPGSIFPRGYYRCVHRYTRGCKATRQVQKGDESCPRIIYIGEHTCRDLSTLEGSSCPSDTTQFHPYHIGEHSRYYLSPVGSDSLILTLRSTTRSTNE